MSDAIDAAAVQLNIIADEAYGKITSAVDDMMGTKIPELNDEIKSQMPGSVGQFVDAAWSETNSLVQKINDSDAVSNQRSALQDQLQEIADATGSDGLDTFLTKTEKLNEDVNSATTELLESESGFSLTASVAAVLAVTTLAF